VGFAPKPINSFSKKSFNHAASYLINENKHAESFSAFASPSHKLNREKVVVNFKQTKARYHHTRPDLFMIRERKNMPHKTLPLIEGCQN
jgi:hypothetical protein